MSPNTIEHLIGSLPLAHLGRASAWALLGLFVVHFPLTSTQGRLVLCAVYAVLAVVALIINRQHIFATITAPFAGHTVVYASHHPDTHQATN